MEFEIGETDQFEERYNSVIPESLKKSAIKKIFSLKENADKKGKPIRYSFFREIKKYEEWKIKRKRGLNNTRNHTENN